MMSINKFGPIALVYPDGSPVAAEAIAVIGRESGSPATLFANLAGTVPLPNPVETDALGMLQFYAEEGAYDIQVLESGFTMTAVVYPPDALVEFGEVKVQAAPSSSWNFPHGLGRLPTVALYLASGEEVEADITASTTEVSVVWPEPVAGKMVLT